MKCSLSCGRGSTSSYKGNLEGPRACKEGSLDCHPSRPTYAPRFKMHSMAPGFQGEYIAACVFYFLQKGGRDFRLKYAPANKIDRNDFGQKHYPAEAISSSRLTPPVHLQAPFLLPLSRSRPRRCKLASAPPHAGMQLTKDLIRSLPLKMRAGYTLAYP